ncbi:hypothetical protein [Polaromonas sp.]|uniref:hypothetical protein n=1 Tax=Polaromonas sp. TaxID=1869339 RepID=UPI00286A18AF|nr:hypothetical protein [Polaromonas sp.]
MNTLYRANSGNDSRRNGKRQGFQAASREASRVVTASKQLAAKKIGNALICIAMGLVLAPMGWFAAAGYGVCGVLLLFAWATYVSTRVERDDPHSLPSSPGGSPRRNSRAVGR